MPNVFEEGWGCPVCELPVIRIIQEVGKPTRYFHAGNNVPELVHEDLMTELKVENELNQSINAEPKDVNDDALSAYNILGRPKPLKGCPFHYGHYVGHCPSCRATSGVED